jgi:hypothetical protein
MGTSEMLEKVALACATVADKVNDVKDETPYTMRKLTAKGQPHFRFTMLLELDGQSVEVQVRSMPKILL